MNVIHKSIGVEPGTDRIDFPAESILTTITDTRGVITHANREFCEASGFNYDELVGSPHRIVRHKDMPKALFHLCWHRLKAGRPVAAYIKNKAKSGDHNWVFALMLPLPDGYLSMRIRPSGAQFENIRAIYKSALDCENRGVEADETCRMLTNDVRTLGYSGYTEFMSVALGEELARRAQTLNQEVPPRIAVLEDLAARVRSMIGTASELGEGFRNIRNEPVNMRILSNRLESGGASISMISQNYDTMAQEMSFNFDRLCSEDQGALSQIWQATGNGSLAILSAHLIRELASVTSATAETDENKLRGYDIIRAHADRLEKQAQEEVNSINRSCTTIPEVSRQLRRRINGLDVVKLLCRVENCRIGSRDAGLTAIIERLEGFHSETDALLGTLSKDAMQVSQTANGLI